MRITAKFRSIHTYDYEDENGIQYPAYGPFIMGYELTSNKSILPFDFNDGELEFEIVDGYLYVNADYSNIEVYNYQTGSLVYSDVSEEDKLIDFDIHTFRGAHISNVKVYMECFFDKEKTISIEFEPIEITFEDEEGKIKYPVNFNKKGAKNV